MSEPAPPAAVFIGSPTSDVVVQAGSAHQVTGGAAFISALAARWAGSTAGIVARVPPVLPAMASSVFGPGGLHRGGLRCADGSLPGFRISYDDAEQATYTGIHTGLEAALCAEDIPTTWLGPTTQWIHIAGIGFSAAQQLRMLEDIKARTPGWGGTLSVGTCAGMLSADLDASRALLFAADVLFLNDSEFELLCPEGFPPDCDTVVLVTRGKAGVEVHGGAHTGLHSATAVSVIDPTGAGDAFCGAFIGASILGESDPIAKGQQAAAHVLAGLGSTTLSHWVAAQVGTRADHAVDATLALAPAMTACAQSAAFDFSDPPHLAVGHPHALAMLCISTLHQYGFWTASAEAGWQGPMFARLDGKTYKGSDFIWAAFARAARTDPSQLSVDRMGREPDLFATICTDDTGSCPVPQLASHASLHATHATVMARQWDGDYGALIAHANAHPKPIATLLDSLRRLPGYMADPLAKKANLLAIILAARPEGFLQARDPESIVPIVDYHMMRLCLRTGLVTITDPDLRRRLVGRLWVDTQEELAIRQATGRAILGLVEKTRLSIGAIDGLFFKLGRTVCLETEPPQCSDCPLNSHCAQDTALFQPVFRTTAY